MDAKLLFWTVALLNMGVVVGLGAHGIRLVRRGEVQRHRRAMLAASVLVVGFVVAYVLKVAFLGGEDLDTWSSAARGVLYFHETCVAAMLVGGAVAGWRAWKLRGTRLLTRNAADPPAPAGAFRLHRLAGRAAMIAAVLGVLSATVMLGGMYSRGDATDSALLTRFE
ncbi:MAG: DUF420 domain-containing protein [Myxococcales bacterium]|nr:DUF420 domain-containing protein [Myxococcales bacterium]